MTSKHEQRKSRSGPYSVSDVISFLNTRAPIGTAAEWDNVGLLLGDASRNVTGIVLSIDLNSEVLKFAKSKGCNLIVNHHPFIFPKGKGPSRILSGSLAYEAIQSGISVAAYHTNFDSCALEVADAICKNLGLQPKGRLLERTQGQLTKLVVYVPQTHAEQVRQALSESGAGHIGDYDSCTFATLGEGTFRGGESSQPFLGKSGVLERVEEIRLETIFPSGLREIVLKSLHQAHPYEEIAYDLYLVEQNVTPKGMIRGLGYGFWGEFPKSRPFSEFAKGVKSLFKLNGFWITSPVPSKVKRIGFAAGKGASLIQAAADLNCDLFITGEAGYHPALAGFRPGTAVMELGHRESEKFFIETMKKWLSVLDLPCVESETATQQIWLGGKQ